MAIDRTILASFPGWVMVLIGLVGCASGALTAPSTVLPVGQVEAVLRTCSRPSPGPIDGTWDVPDLVVARLEEDLRKLDGVRSRQCCFLHARLRDPGSFFRQYAGIVIGGRKLVYINAFRDDHFPRWRKEAVSVCDGGDYYWGAVYDPENRQFSELAFNGEA